MTNMVCLAALCLLFIFPLSSSQSTLESEQKISAHKAPGAAPPPPPPHIRDLLQKEETNNLNAMRTCKCVNTGEESFMFTAIQQWDKIIS